MAHLDLYISICIWVSGIGLSVVGIEMTITPPTADKPNRKWTYRGIFALLGLTFVGASLWQQVRDDYKKQQAEAQHTEELIRNEGNSKYTQGQLDSITKILDSLVKNSTPNSVAAAVRSAIPPIAQSIPQTGRHLNDVQRQRLAVLFAKIPGNVEIRVHTVADNNEAVRYATELNDVVNTARKTKYDLIRGSLWEKIPEGVLVCVHSTQDAAVMDAANVIGAEMIAVGIAVIMNPNDTFPEHTVTILVGVQPST